MVKTGDPHDSHGGGPFSGHPTGPLRAQALLGQGFPSGGAASSPEGAPAKTSHGAASPALPFHLEADPRALPPAPVALALIPLLVLLLLALRPDSPFRDWCRTSFEDFWGLFRPIRKRRHVIHDKPYLDRVLQAEFGARRSRSSNAPVAGTRSSGESRADTPSSQPQPSDKPPEPEA